MNEGQNSKCSRSTWGQMGVGTPTRSFLCFSVIHLSVNNSWCVKSIEWKICNLYRDKLQKPYLWTSLSPLLFVICHVNPLFGSKPGCDISSPCFFTNLIYLLHVEKYFKSQWSFSKDNLLDKLSAYSSALKCSTPRSSSHMNMYSYGATMSGCKNLLAYHLE